MRMQWVLCFLLLTFVHSICWGDIRVPEDYPTIQEAVNAAGSQDTILISDGTYKGLGNRDITVTGKDITIRSTHGATTCTIDCEHGGRGFLVNNSYLNLIGLTITNGIAETGGGIHCEANTQLLMSNCIITQNSASGGISWAGYGGGLYIRKSYAILENTEVSYNDAGGYDGGWGAGIYCFSDENDSMLLMKFCNIHHNGSDTDCYRGLLGGGGVYLYKTDLEAYDTRFTDNIACSGAGIESLDSTITLGLTRFVNNLSYRSGSAVSIYDSYLHLMNCILVFNNTESSTNPGSAIWANGSYVNIVFSTIADNTSNSGFGGIFCEAGCTGSLTTSIYHNNTGISPGADGLYVNHSCIDGGWTGSGNIGGDPLFTSAAEGNYFLSQASSGQLQTSICVDALYDYAGPTHYEFQFISPTYNEISMTDLTTRTDHLMDEYANDIGFHYPDGINPCQTLGCTIDMPSHNFSKNSQCWLKVWICNPEADKTVSTPIFVVMDLWGQYFFAPSFSNSLDYYNEYLYHGMTSITPIPFFIWPEIEGAASGIMVYAAMTDPEISRLEGEMDTWEFGWN